MGQLEKYGLYVLCLVIFLILGVALWGDPAAAGERRRDEASRGQQMQAKAPPANAQFDLNEFADLMGARRPSTPANAPVRVPASLPTTPQRSEPAVQVPPAADPVVETQPARDATPPNPSTGRRSYKVAAGDTLSAIAMDQLGSMRFQALIEQLNPGLRPERLRVGQEIVLPSEAEVGAARAVRAGGEAPTSVATTRTYTIERGDTLEGVALSELGSKTRVEDIKRLNPGIDPRRLRIGQHIRLPND
ncbi:MAG: LysM peptidoglycan-binding domain-containing protein [Planctomycetota bacterium]